MINIINTSLETGNVPDLLKTSTVISTKKVQRTKLIEEYRPINTLPAFGKILEKMVYNQLIDFLENEKILCDFYSRFRHKHSCEHAVQYVVNEWKQGVDEGKVVGITFVDLKRAFERNY